MNETDRSMIAIAMGTKDPDAQHSQANSPVAGPARHPSESG